MAGWFSPEAIQELIERERTHDAIADLSGELRRPGDGRIEPEYRAVTWAWGEPYPCRFPTNNGMITTYCDGLMTQKGRCFRYEKRGPLWRRFACSKCGRVAHDLKVNPKEVESRGFRSTVRPPSTALPTFPTEKHTEQVQRLLHQWPA